MPDRSNQLVQGSIIILILFFTFFLSGCKNEESSTKWDVLDSNSGIAFEGLSLSALTDSSNALSIDLLEFLNARREEVLTSVQPITNNQYGVVFLVSTSESDIRLLFSLLTKRGAKQAVRLFNGIEITEFIDQTSKLVYSFAYFNQMLRVSASPVLIEQCIRTSQDEQIRSFKERFQRISSFKLLQQDDGNVFLSESSFDRFLMPIWVKKIYRINSQCSNSLLDLKIKEGDFLLNGFSERKPEHISVLPIRSTEIHLMRAVPNSAQYLFHFGLSSLKPFFADTILYKLLGDELIIFGNDADSFSMIVERNEEREYGENMLKSELTFLESHAGLDIFQIDSTSSLLKIGKALTETNLIFLAARNDAYVFSTSVDELKQVIDRIDADDTWGKSVEFQVFFERSLQSSEFSFMMKDVELKSNIQVIDEALTKSGLNRLKWFSLQHNAIEDYVYTNIHFTKEQIEERSSKLVSKQLSAPVINFQALQSDTKSELMVETPDSIYLFDSDGKISGKFHIGLPLVTEVKTVDYLKNKKTQYVMPTGQRVQVIDRLGRALLTIPSKMNEQVEFVNVIDYDRSKNYRLLLASKQFLYLFDKQGKGLDNWSPKVLPSEIMLTPEHYRIGGKDYFFVLTKDWTVHLFNRKGEYVNGFPFKFPVNGAGEIFLERGKSLTESKLFFVSTDGLLYSSSLGNQASTKTELIRHRNADFKLKVSNSKDDFFVLRKDETKLAVFDRLGKMLFELANPSASLSDFQVFDIDRKPQLFSFFDKTQGLNYLYQSSGIPHRISPVDCSLPIAILPTSNTNESRLYFAQAGRLFSVVLDE